MDKSLKYLPDKYKIEWVKTYLWPGLRKETKREFSNKKLVEFFDLALKL